MKKLEQYARISILHLGLFAVLAIGAALGGFAQTNFQQDSPKGAQLRSLNNVLLRIQGQMQEAGPNQMAGLRSQAAIVIAQRAAALNSLIPDNPREALSFAFSLELLADLAAKFPQSASKLEARTNVTGPVQHWIVDSPGFKSSRSLWQMNVGGRTLNLYFAGQEPGNLKQGEQLQVTGVVAGARMAVETSALVQSSASIRTNSGPLLGANKSSHGKQWPAVLLLMCGFLFSLPKPGWRGRIARVRILTFGKHFAIHGLALTVVISTSIPLYAQNSCSTIGIQNTAVLLVNFSDIATTVDSATAYTDFFDTSTGRSLSGYWQEASYGQTSAAGDVFGPITVGASTSYSCSTVFNQLANDVLAAAITGGVNLQNYSRIFVILPNLSCGWAGLTLMGSAGGGCSMLSTSIGPITASLSFLVDVYVSSPQYPFSDARDSAVALAAHEGGHQLGLAHSGTVTQRPIAVLEQPGTAGQITDGGDLFAVMGSNNLGLYQAQQKAEILGWMSSPNYQTVSSSGTYTIQPLETNPPTALQALKIQRGTSSGYYLWLEYKQPIGQYDSTLANAPYTASQPYRGAMVTYEDPYYQGVGQIPGHTYLVDFDLADTYWFTPDLNPSQTWTDLYTNLSLSVLGATSNGLTVAVNYGNANCTPSAPTVTISPLNPSIYPGQSAGYSAAIMNNDSPGCSPSTVNLGSNAPSGWSTSLSASSVTLSPGQSTNVTMGKGAPSGTPAGTYAVNLNAAASSSTASGTANATVMTPPSLAVSVSLSGSTFSAPGTVPITASVSNGGTPASGANVNFTLTAPNGTTSTQAATTGSNGMATWNFKLNAKSLRGTYTVEAQASLSSGTKKNNNTTQTATSNTGTFTVQ